MSLFNRPAWAKSQAATNTEDSESNIFSHSDRSYREIIAEQERKKQEKIEKKKAKEERRSSAKRESNSDRNEDATSKRRRLSVEDDGEGQDLSFTDREASPGIGEHNHGTENLRARAEHDFFDQQYDRPSEVVELGSSDNEDQSAEVTTVSNRTRASAKGLRARGDYMSSQAGSKHAREMAPSKAALQPVEILDDESDDEFAELARRAREERQQKAQSTKQSRTPDLTTQSLSSAANDLDTGQHTQDTPLPDPPVQLFISSRLPDTREMIIYRKLSQNLAEVRKVWCRKQGFTDEETKDVFFIHRMRRVYDVTTCRSLGLEVDSFGNITLKGAEGKEDLDKIHLEAVTDSVFQQMKAESTQEQRGGGKTSADTDDNGDEATDEQPKEESHIRLVLKASKKPDFRLKVKPTTTFSKIVSAFAKTNLQDGETAYLAFDGEQLNPNDEVQNTEISDMDCIEVHISAG